MVPKKLYRLCGPSQELSTGGSIKKFVGYVIIISSLFIIGLVVLNVTVTCVFCVPGTARARVMPVVVVVPVEVAAYFVDHIGVEPPTDNVHGLKGDDEAEVMVNPVSVMVAVLPIVQAAPPA